MTHETSPRRDQREIVVPGDRPPNRVAPRRTAPARSASVPPGEMRAALVAGLGWIGRTCLARPGEVAGTVIALGAVAFISANALGFQIGRHPAPILPQPAPALADAVPARPEPAKLDPGKADAAAAARSAEAKPAAEAAAPTRPEPRQAARGSAHDAIGDILRADEATGSTTSAAPKPDKGVMQAQRALAKLGYATLKPDGLMGPATRTAIERFERERKLPVTGAATGRTLRELAARAGAAKG